MNDMTDDWLLRRALDRLAVPAVPRDFDLRVMQALDGNRSGVGSLWSWPERLMHSLRPAQWATAGALAVAVIGAVYIAPQTLDIAPASYTATTQIAAPQDMGQILAETYVETLENMELTLRDQRADYFQGVYGPPAPQTLAPNSETEQIEQFLDDLLGIESRTI